MPKTVHITTPPLTFDEVARRLRIPKRRQKALRAMAEEGVRQILEARKVAAEKPAVKRKVKPRNASAAA